jgi:hypothetical protein
MKHAPQGFMFGYQVSRIFGIRDQHLRALVRETHIPKGNEIMIDRQNTIISMLLHIPQFELQKFLLVMRMQDVSYIRRG